MIVIQRRQHLSNDGDVAEMAAMWQRQNLFDDGRGDRDNRNMAEPQLIVMSQTRRTLPGLKTHLQPINGQYIMRSTVLGDSVFGPQHLMCVFDMLEAQPMPLRVLAYRE